MVLVNIVEEDTRERSYESTFEIDEGYVRFTDIFDIDDLFKKTSLTIGRFDLSDKREWLFDKSLDGVLVSFELEPIDTKFDLSKLLEVGVMQLRNLYEQLSNAFDGIQPIAISARNTLLDAASTAAYSGNSTTLQQPFLDVMKRPNAHPVVRV